MNNRNIERVFNVAEHNLFTVNGSMDYARITETITRLSNLIMESHTDESTWWIGEHNYICLADLVTGAFWHYTEWHGGQWSPEYAALCALGNVYSPNMETVDTKNDAYIILNELAAKGG